MTGDPAVLIAVLKDRRDLRLLRERGMYRIPAARAPRRTFAWIAFYQPKGFGPGASRIRWCAPVLGSRVATRRELVPEEPDHPRAEAAYVAYRMGRPLPLPAPVRNVPPRRVTFAFTTLRRLFASRDLLGVLGIPPIEGIMAKALAAARVPALREFTVAGGTLGRFRLDFAVFCRRGAVAVECDGEVWHDRPAQRARDGRKDAALGRLGWNVVRLAEADILADARACARRVAAAAARLGGPARA